MCTKYTYLSCIKSNNMARFTLRIDKTAHKVEILEGFTVDYSGVLPGNFNNNGVWGHITNPGVVVKSEGYNPNKWCGKGSFPDVESRIKCDLISLNNQQA